MKKSLKLLLCGLLAVLCLVFAVACTQTTPPGDNTVTPGGSDDYTEQVVGDLIDYDGKYEINKENHPYGDEPDLDDVIIDGYFDEDIWQNKAWYSQYMTENPNLRLDVTVHMTEGGLYLAAKSDDKYIFWNGRNRFYYNTYFQMNMYSGNNFSFKIDANNTNPVNSIYNARSRYEGELNTQGGGRGLFVEAFFTWERLGYESKPETIKMLPLYYWTLRMGTAPTALLPTFVTAAGNANQALLFNENGYADADPAGSTVGTHVKGLGKTNGWVIENAGTEDETITSINKPGYTGYVHTAFFKEMYANRFMMQTRVTVNSGSNLARAGLVMYVDDIKYRTFALEITNDIYRNGVLLSLPIKAYTNYPTTITATTHVAELTPNTENGRAANQFDITIFGNNGMMYYLVNDEFVYSEDASYIKNVYGGFYTYDTDVTFSNYSYESFPTEEEVKEKIANHCYTVDLKNKTPNYVTGSLVQVATANDGNGSVELTLTLNAGREIDDNTYRTHELTELYYEYTDKSGALQKVDLMDECKANAVGGKFLIKNVPGNILIYTAGTYKDVPMTDLIDIKLQMFSKQIDEGVTGVSVLLEGDGPYDRYNVNANLAGGNLIAKVFPGKKWKFTATKTGFRTTTGEVNNYEPLNESMVEPQVVNLEGTVVGGTASGVLGPDGKPVTTLTVGSAPGIYWDLSEEENRKVTFTSTNTGSSYIYYSGRTISDYQVAYVEITNQTDYMAFQSIEDDPAAGFVISTSGANVRCGLLKTGVRILPTNNWADHIDKTGLVGWTGGIATIDRNNGGRVVGEPTLGKGTVNRVPMKGQTYTTSFLMIRKGGNVYLYAGDGRLDIKNDGSNFQSLLDSGKLVPFYSDYFSQATGYAAIGYFITVSYNLRLDFENYWILAGDDAAAFADDIISTDLKVEGADLVKLESDGLSGYAIDEADKTLGVGKIAKSSELVIKAANDLPEGKIIKLAMSDGSVTYINSKDSYGVLNVLSIEEAVNIKAQLVDAIKVSGTISIPGDVSVSNREGQVFNEDGVEVGTFMTDGNGAFSVMVPKSTNVKLKVNVAGYAMQNVEVNSAENVNVGDVGFAKLTFGSKVGAFTSSSGMTYGMDEKFHGAYANYEATAGDAFLTINPELNNKSDFVFTFSYIRSSAAENGSAAKDEADLGLGIIMNGDDASNIQTLAIRKGYRILRPSWNGRVPGEGETTGAVNIQPATIGLDNYAQLKFIKSGSTIYMYSKYAKDAEYKLIVAWDAQDESGASILAGSVTFAIKMTVTSGCYLNLTFFDIKVEEVNKDTAPEIISTVTVQQPAETDGSIAVSGQTADTFTTVGQSTLDVTVTPAAEKKLVALYVNVLDEKGAVKEKIAQDLGGYTEGTFRGKVTTKGTCTITAEFAWVTYEHKVEKIKIAELNGMAYVKLTNGTDTYVMTVSRLASELSETVVYLNTTSRELTLMAPKGTWTLQFFSDKDCTKQVGSDRTITIG